MHGQHQPLMWSSSLLNPLCGTLQKIKTSPLLLKEKQTTYMSFAKPFATFFFSKCLHILQKTALILVQVFFPPNQDSNYFLAYNQKIKSLNVSTNLLFKIAWMPSKKDHLQVWDIMSQSNLHYNNTQIRTHVNRGKTWVNNSRKWVKTCEHQ